MSGALPSQILEWCDGLHKGAYVDIDGFRYHTYEGVRTLAHLMGVDVKGIKFSMVGALLYSSECHGITDEQCMWMYEELYNELGDSVSAWGDESYREIEDVIEKFREVGARMEQMSERQLAWSGGPSGVDRLTRAYFDRFAEYGRQ